MNSNRCHRCGLPYKTLARVCDRCSYTSHDHESHGASQADAAEELRKIALWERVPHPRCLSAFWFACAGSIPGILIWLFLVKDPHTTVFVIFGLTLAPAVIAGSYGAWVGVGILDPDTIFTGFGAFWRGGFVALLSFLTLIALLAVTITITDSPTNVFQLFIFLLFFGFLFAGWETVLIGGLAGWLLYKRYR